jgi:Zn-dependent protease
MSPTELTQRCRNCTQEVAADTLACPRCNTLVHADELERIAADAKNLEASGQFRPARDRWLQALPLLPKDSQQTAWIQKHAKELLNQALAKEKPQSKWAKRLGPLGPIAILLAKAKTALLAIFKLKFLLSFAAFLAVYWALWGPKFGIGFAVLILIHELGHFIDVKRRGLPAEMPFFLPGLGAYVKWQALGVSQATRSAVSLAGPLAGWIGSMICLAIWWQTGDQIWAGLARASAWLNVMNLIPIWVLDGGSAAKALGMLERFLLLTASLALLLILREPVFLFLAAGVVYRLFKNDSAPQTSRFIAAYYVALLVCLGVVLHFVPGQIFPDSAGIH